MKLEEFVGKYSGRKVDFDGAFGAQCVDLFRQYCRDVLRIPHTGAVEGAKDLWHSYEKMPLEKKYFAKFSSPQAGDVCVWDETPTNRWGHVAICIGNIGECVIVFEQNGIAQDGAKINLRSRGGLLGALRFKGNL